jgi:hypothetical protein
VTATFAAHLTSSQVRPDQSVAATGCELHHLKVLSERVIGLSTFMIHARIIACQKVASTQSNQIGVLE